MKLVIRISLAFLLIFILQTGVEAADLSPSDMLVRGERLTASGLYSEAESVFDSILDIPRLRKSFEFQALDGRARCRKLRADYGRAAEDYDRALLLPASIQNKAVVALNKSDLLITTGQYNEAENLLRDLDTIPDLPIQAKRRLFSNLASIKKYEGKFELSADIYRSILNMESTPLERALTLQNLGILLLDLNDSGNSVGALEEAYKLLSEEDDKSISSAIVLSNLALAKVIDGDMTGASEKIDTAIRIIENCLGPEHPDYLTALRKRGEIHLISGEKDLALKTFQPYFAKLRSYILRTLPTMSEQARLDYWKKERPLISEIFATEDTDPTFLADVALLRRAIALSGADKAFGEKVHLKLGVTSNDIRKNLRNNEIGIDFVIYPDFSTNGMKVNKLGAIIIYPEKSGEKSKFITYGAVTDIENRKSGNRTLITALRSGNDRNNNIIYSDTTLFSTIWDPILDIIPSGSTIHFVPDGFLNLLAIESLPAPVANSKANSIKFRRHTSLYNLLDRKSYVSKRGSENESNMLVAGGFNYDSLPTFSSENDPTGSKIPNHDSYNFLISRLNGTKPVFKTLPGMKEEILSISSMMGDATTTDTLSEEGFKNLPPSVNRLHIATHGYAIDNKEAPTPFSMRDSIGADNSLLASGLVLSGANIAPGFPDREDGLVSARELCDLDLSAMECIVLAACQTAIGEVSDEGPAGLLRGLKKAGAATVLATLWEVDDNATLLFMTEFYTALKQGMGYSKAYDHAKQEVRQHKITVPVMRERFDPATLCTVYEETDETEDLYPFRDPTYWAPFILVDATD